jgi:hypothetical protein
MSDFLVCSFHTDDDYYRRHGKELESNLTDLGARYVIEEVQKQEGQDWADLCRQKVPYLQRICDENPDSKVFWIDVDCRLLSLPDFVRDSTADIIGFQRGFSSPRAIGYHKRSRFWEPCFWGVNNTPHARRMIADAAQLEQRSQTKATDDYFFEEGWRANAKELTFQMIPSSCVVGRGGPYSSRSAFFAFGSSGNVAEFKDKVVQHASDAPAVNKIRPANARRLVVKVGKRVVKRLPPAMRRRVIAAADKHGATALLLPGTPAVGTAPRIPTAKLRRTVLNQALRGGLDGNVEVLEGRTEDLLRLGVPTPEETGTLGAARSFAHYAGRPVTDTVNLVWWARPFPGNYGDWLSPFLVSQVTDKRIVFQSPTAPWLTTGKHLVAVGSIGRFVKPNSVVVGTGLSSDEYQLDPAAEYCSLRGPLSAGHLRTCGGPVVDSFGDPAAVLSRVIPIGRGVTNGRTAFIRHFKHRNLPVILPQKYDELEVLVSHPDDIRRLVTTLAEYDRVVTSAMHVLITCQSYGIPCALVVFDGHVNAVAGNGMKYTDYSLGVGLGPLDPAPVPLDLRAIDITSLVMDVKISDSKQDEVEDALRQAVDAVSR